ncbi:hypothetical protein MMB232_02071 [Brevundimonas subvibrioides]
MRSTVRLFLELVHVDEVDDHQTGEVAQAQLAGGLDGGLAVGLEGRGLDVAFLGRAARVDVDGDQGLGLVDHQIAAGLQRHDRLVDLRQQLLDAVGGEQRLRPLIQVHLLGLRGHQHPHEVARFLEALDALDLDAVEILVEHVAHGAADQVFFFVDQRGGVGGEGGLADRLPQTQQIFVVALDLGLGALGAGRADDQAHAARHVQGRGGGLQALAIGGLGDLAGDAAALAGVGHQHAVAAGQRQPGGQGRALAAALVLDDLHQQDLATLDDVLDLVAPHQATLQALLLGHSAFGIAVIGITGVLVVGVVIGRVRLGHDGFTVGGRDLVVVGVDFVEGEEAVTIAAVLDEGGLQAGLYAGDLGEIDVAAKLAFGLRTRSRIPQPGGRPRWRRGFLPRAPHR